MEEIDWSGNIRELRNVVERLIILSSETVSKMDVLNYVVPSSRNRTTNVPFPSIFEKFENADELTEFINEAYSKYKSESQL